MTVRWAIQVILMTIFNSYCISHKPQILVRAESDTKYCNGQGRLILNKRRKQERAPKADPDLQSVAASGKLLAFPVTHLARVS